MYQSTFPQGLHLDRSPSFVTPDQPPSAKDRSPHLLDLVASLQMLRRWSSHRGYLNKKWSTDSDSRPQLQLSASIAPTLARYLLSLHIPDLSWHSVAASVYVLPLYSAKMCSPGSALSKLWVNLPIWGFVHGEAGEKNPVRPCSRATDCSVGCVDTFDEGKEDGTPELLEDSLKPYEY